MTQVDQRYTAKIPQQPGVTKASVRISMRDKQKGVVLVQTLDQVIEVGRNATGAFSSRASFSSSSDSSSEMASEPQASTSSSFSSAISQSSASRSSVAAANTAGRSSGGGGAMSLGLLLLCSLLFGRRRATS